jgi:protein SYS1
MPQGKLFGSDTFDPKYIISQILLLQSLFYSIQFSLSALISNVFGVRSNLDQIFGIKVLDIQDSYSLVYILSNLLSTPFIVGSVVFIVERTSKCLDFTGTIYVIHLLVVYLYSGIPLSMIWWGLNLGVLFVSVLLSEYICLKIEQKEIYLNFAKNKEDKT